jgi:hypothetical protein
MGVILSLIGFPLFLFYFIAKMAGERAHIINYDQLAMIRR